jgi:iron complex transport system substrate-binding protein
MLKKFRKSLTQHFGTILLLGLLSLSLVLAACGDTATPAPLATTTPAATTTAATSTATTAVATTTAATSTATTVATTTSAATTTTAVVMANATSYPLTLTDDNKRTITLTKAPLKIVSLAPSNTEILFALGLGDKIIGVDQYSNYPEQAKTLPKIGGFSDTNVEAVTALAPDLVLAAGIQSQQQITALEKQNIKVLVLNPVDLAGVVKDFRLVGQATNTNDKALTLATDFQSRLDAIATKLKTVTAKPRVYFELDPTLFTVGPGSFVADMLDKAGGQNIVTDTSNAYPQLTQEVIVAKNPQVIFLGDDTNGSDTPTQLLTRSGWNVIDAVKNKRVYAVTADLTNRPGPRAVQGVEQIAKFLYPDLFK